MLNFSHEFENPPHRGDEVLKVVAPAFNLLCVFVVLKLHLLESK